MKLASKLPTQADQPIRFDHPGIIIHLSVATMAWRTLQTDDGPKRHLIFYSRRKVGVWRTGLFFSCWYWASTSHAAFLNSRPPSQRAQEVLARAKPPDLDARNRQLHAQLCSSSSAGNKGSFRPKSKRNSRSSDRNGGKRDLLASPQTWRVFGINVHPDLLSDTPPMDTKTNFDKLYLNAPVLSALRARLRLVEDEEEGTETPSKLLDVRVVRRSLDARRKSRGGEESGPRYAFVLDVDITKGVARDLKLRNQPGRLELLPDSRTTVADYTSASHVDPAADKPRVIVIGAGPAGLFCALTLARSGVAVPILFERGQPVESRGKDIGALMHRRSLDSESNFAFGEGGAGTWSDGKLTTRIGRNSQDVRYVLETLVKYGAPQTILIDGAPHLGTDNLVRLLRNMRQDLRDLGGQIHFGAKVSGLVMEEGCVKGVNVEIGKAMERGPGGGPILQDPVERQTHLGDAVVLAAGHSARDMYEELHAAGIQLEAKGFATGFRIEHPQKVINEIQYGAEWAPRVVTGKRVTDSANEEYIAKRLHRDSAIHPGRLPVPSYRLATDKAFDGSHPRGAYSFCMCPGGQIVPASTDPDEVCVNGMSFSKRDSLWANSALVVTIAADDEILDPYREVHGVLAGVAFQRDMERRASKMGGGNLTVPVQRLTDFMAGQASTSAPPSSYRLGVKPAACHEIYPTPVTQALRDAISNHFEKLMPGFLCDDGLLHAVETRTSSPVRVARNMNTMQAIGTERLFPAGEGAGYAGGIVSAAVDGKIVAEAVMARLCPEDESVHSERGRTPSIGFTY